MNVDELVEAIADSVLRRFPNIEITKAVASDIREIKEGYMEESEAGAMVVDLIKTLTEDTYKR